MSHWLASSAARLMPLRNKTVPELLSLAGGVPFPSPLEAELALRLEAAYKEAKMQYNMATAFVCLVFITWLGVVAMTFIVGSTCP